MHSINTSGTHIICHIYVQEAKQSTTKMPEITNFSWTMWDMRLLISCVKVYVPVCMTQSKCLNHLIWLYSVTYVTILSVTLVPKKWYKILERTNFISSSSV